MASKGVIERKQSADDIVSLLAQRGRALASAAGEALDAPSLLLRLVPLLGELLARARDGMLQADLRHEQELGANCAARDEGDGAAQCLNEMLSEVKETMSVLYGADIAGKVFRTKIPDDPAVLDRFASEVVQRLERVVLPPSRVLRTELDTAVTSQRIQDAHAALATKLHAIVTQNAGAQGSWVKRNRAIERHDRVFRAVALVLMGLATLADDEEFGEAVRPSPIHPGRTALQKLGPGT